MKIVVEILGYLYKINNKYLRKFIIKTLSKIDNGYYWSNEIRYLYKKYHDIEIGIGTYGGCFDLEKIPSGTVFGKFCSIAPTIYIFNANHPKEFISTHPMVYNPILGMVEKEKIKRNKLTVGNDTWIGQNVIITSSVTSIGNGAIIGAGSVVTKDVEEYSIVAGNPAKVIGYRFENETIEKIKRNPWWNWDIDYIKENIDLFSNENNLDKI